MRSKNPYFEALAVMVACYVFGALLLASFLKAANPAHYSNINFANYVAVGLGSSLILWLFSIWLLGKVLGKSWLMAAMRKAARSIDDEIREDYKTEPTRFLRIKVALKRTMKTAFACVILGGFLGWLVGRAGNLSEPCFAIGFVGALTRSIYNLYRYKMH